MSAAIPHKLHRGFRSRVIDAIIDALRALRPIAGAGIRTRQTPEGTIIESADVCNDPLRRTVLTTEIGEEDIVIDAEDVSDDERKAMATREKKKSTLIESGRVTLFAPDEKSTLAEAGKIAVAASEKESTIDPDKVAVADGASVMDAGKVEVGDGKVSADSSDIPSDENARFRKVEFVADIDAEGKPVKKNYHVLSTEPKSKDGGGDGGDTDGCGDIGFPGDESGGGGGGGGTSGEGGGGSGGFPGAGEGGGEGGGGSGEFPGKDNPCW